MRYAVISMTVLLEISNVLSGGDAPAPSRPVTAPSETARLSTLEIGALTGQRFVLLQKIAKAQPFGYQSFEPSLPYSQWVGKVLEVAGVESGTPPVVLFKTADGTTVRATAYNGTIHDIAPLRDLDYARKRWLAKSL
jgi:hypothetical protein